MYTPFNWQNHVDIITADRLNNIEQGVSNAEIGGVLPQLALTGDTTNMTGDVKVPLQFNYRDGRQQVTGYLTAKWQGDSSEKYPKKNLSLNFYHDDKLSKKLKWKPKSTWKKDTEFNLKANWIDRTQARNLVNARLAAQVAAARPIYWGGQNMLPANNANFELNQTEKFIRLDTNINKAVLSQKLTCSLDLALDADTGTDSTGASLNKGCVWFQDEVGTWLGFTIFDMSDVAVGTNKHFNVSLQAAAGHFIQTVTFNCGPKSSVGTGHMTFSNVSLYVADAEPANYQYAPSLWDSRQALAASPYYGEVYGLPVEMTLNGQPQGLYTLNSKKNANLVGMDDSDSKQVLIEISNDNPFAANHVLKFDGTDADAVVAADNNQARAQFQRLVTFVQTATDDDFKANVAQYLDLYSVIDTHILTDLMNNIDGGTKSILFATYDGQHWLAIPYDMDSTWQSYWDGTGPSDPWNYDMSMNNLTNRVITLFHDLVIERYNVLRNDILAGGHIVNEFERFIDQIPTTAYDNNEQLWPTIPSIGWTDFCQIKQAITTLLALTDNEIQWAVSDSTVDTSTT